MMNKEDMLKKLADCVCDMEDEEIVDAVQEYLAAGYDPQEGLLNGLVEGMRRASELYEEGEYFVPELIVCSDAMYAGIGEIQKALPEGAQETIGKVVIGVLGGDTPDIGKNLVRIMLETGGFEVHDLGRDVPISAFVQYVKDHDVDILCMSSLMTTTMPGMEQVIIELKKEGLRDKVKVMVGGAPVSAAFAEKIGAPVSNTLMGKGNIDSNHPLYTGMIGMHGTKASNIAATKCDLFIAIGARFSDRVLGKKEHIKNAKVIHIDVDPAEINKNIKVDAFLIGDAKLVLQRLIEAVDEKKNEEWIEDIRKIKKEGDVIKDSPNLTPEFLFQKLNQLDKGNLIISTEVGQHQMWAAQYFNFKRPRTFISSGGLGTMGYGLGACIGAQVGKPECKVINIAGDGSFGMNCNEIATAVSNHLPIVMIIMNNNVLGMVRQWQQLFYEGRYSQTTLNRKTDFVKLAEAFGAKGFGVTEKDQLEGVLKEALESKEPVLIDYRINCEKKVFPMVAPGAPISEIITEEDLEK